VYYSLFSIAGGLSGRQILGTMLVSLYMPTLTLEQKIQETIAEVQPMLGLHGGSIEVVRITPDRVVELRFKGTCIGCAAANYTLEYGLKEMLMIKIDEIEDVIAVNDEPVTHEAPAIPLPYQTA